jgi:hypothetical protein
MVSSQVSDTVIESQKIEGFLNGLKLCLGRRIKDGYDCSAF